jgi:hypothetical protein
VFRKQTSLSEPQARLINLAGKADILIHYGTTYDSSFPGMIGSETRMLRRISDTSKRCFSESHSPRVRGAALGDVHKRGGPS